MEMQLQELIDQIRKNGVEAAEAEAARILSGAKEEADRILSEAQAEAAKTVEAAREESDRLTRVGEESLRKAGRNLLLSFRESVCRELSAIVSESVTAAYRGDELATLAAKAVSAFLDDPENGQIALLLPPADLARLEGTLAAAFKDRLAAGVTLTTDDNCTAGFRVSVEGGQAYYDFSAEAVAEMLCPYLTPRVAALMKEAAEA